MIEYKAVGFDYGGVIKGKPNTFFRSAVCKLLGITKEEYQQAYFRHSEKVNLGNVSWVEFWTDVLAELGQPDKVQHIMELSRETFGQPISQDMLQLVGTLREMGIKVGLLSNNTADAGRKMRENAIDNHFDVFHVSGETGLMKPSPEAFEFFARELGVKAIELTFIDDSESSLSSAEICGFTPILFKSYEDLRKELVALRIIDQ